RGQIPGAAGARQRARRRGLERAAPGPAAEAHHARQRQVGDRDVHDRADRRLAQPDGPGRGDRRRRRGLQARDTERWKPGRGLRPRRRRHACPVVDLVWVKHIKAALMENRFRLVQQPVASLQGEDPAMFDVLVRMIDGSGKEVLPSEFMAAAERNDLMKNIDRWVVGASLSFAAQRKPGCLFVRLSKDTVADATFQGWLENHVRSSRADPGRLCFQVNEGVASTYAPQVKALAAALRQRGFRFAIDGFGSGRDSQGLLDAVPLDFVKIDGALVQSLAGDQGLQSRTRTLVDAATKRLIQTIAERVEDANTMAVLWQIGVQYIQGYFINEPEQVVLGAAQGR